MFTFRVELAAEPDRVWAHATTLAGVNHELMPWMRMTAPPGFRSLAELPEGIQLGETWFASWILLFGVLPLERAQVTPIVLDVEGRRFVEESPMVWMRSWRHERLIETCDGGSRLTDRLTPEPRLPGFGPIVRTFVRRIFTHRHHRLAQLYGRPSADRTGSR